MRIVAPMFLCPVLRPFTAAGARRLGVSVVSAWSLSGAPLSVQELWPRFVKAAGPETALDQGIPKSASEFLVLGRAYAAEPTTHLAVSVEVGSKRKVLNVVGDRIWRKGVPTPPAPFETMPLEWRHAFGGEGFAENPLGKGYVIGFADGVELPNLELPGRMIGSPHDRPPPAGFGAFPIDWPQRMRGLGTYDQKWFENDFPGFARDIDWRVHNVAPEDQRLDEPFAPGERIVMHNLSPAEARCELALPHVAARCFIYRDESLCALEEVALALRTLWLVPSEDMFVLVFQGSHPISTMLASDVKGVLLGLDASEHLRDTEHFGRALTQRLDRELGAAEMLDDRPLMPEGMAFPGFDERAEDLTLPARRGLLEANVKTGGELRRQEALRLFSEAGFEGGEALFPPNVPAPPSNAPLTEQVRQAFEEAEAQRKRAEEQLAALRAEAMAELEQLGLDPGFLDRARSGPPPILAAQQLAVLQEIVRDGRARGEPMELFERQLDDPDFHRALFEKEAAGREAYRLSAHSDDSVPELALERTSSIRDEVEHAIRERASLSQTDLTGADLAELDLSGMDLTGAWLEGANLQNANLANARLDYAVMAKANLGEAVLDGTSLYKANLGKARLVWTQLTGCNLEQAILDSADLRSAVFARCNLGGADLSNVRVEQTRFVESDLTGITFLQMALADTRFEGCKLDDANFIEVSLNGASFDRCRMAKSVFVTCTGERTVFTDAILENARFVSGCRFDDADFRRADLRRSTLRSCSFERARFDGANLGESDVSQAKFEGARFHHADLRRVLATECDLKSAVLTGVNLMFAILQGSDIRGADLRGSNLFSADFALVHGDDATKLEGSLAGRIRHRPLRKEAPR